jgi:RNA polymerase sigma factor (sigma-70 family)
VLAPEFSAQIVTLRPDIAGFIHGRRRKRHVRTPDFEDELQEALTEIVRSVPQYRNELGEFRPWAFGIALNVHRRFARNRRREGDCFSEYELNADHYEAPGPSPERCAQIQQARGRVEHATHGMPTDQHAALYLHVYEGLSHEDVARELHISVSYSKKLVQRAREYLAKLGMDEKTFFSTHPPLVEMDVQSDEPSQFWRMGYDWVFRAGNVASLLAVMMLAGLIKPSERPVLWFTLPNPAFAVTSNAPTPAEVMPSPQTATISAPVFVPPNRPFTPSVAKASAPIRIDVKPPGKTLYLRKTR